MVSHYKMNINNSNNFFEIYFNQYLPIILTSIDTIRCVSDYNDKDLENKIQFNDYINVYMGCKIFIDNTMKFGEVELR